MHPHSGAIFPAKIRFMSQFDFAAAYHAIRTQEGRMYDDATLRQLPEIGEAHPLHQEWMVRKATFLRLMTYLKARPAGMRILDLGCGNGWMSHHFSRLPGAKVTGMDLNTAELEQARRVFADRDQLRFVEADIFAPMNAQFDVVTMGGSVQYFPDLGRLVGRLRELLVEGGEIHIFDSPFYAENERAAAKERSRRYYTEKGFPELASCYFQPSRNEMEALGGEMRYNPHSFGRRMQRKLLKQVDSPFIWWCLRK